MQKRREESPTVATNGRLLTSITGCKCFLHITPAEQARRFKDRLANPLKRWKLSYEDFRNRARWADYELAIRVEMMRKTSTKQSPWYLVPTNDKLYGRLAVFTILVDVLGLLAINQPRPLDPKIAEMAKAFSLSSASYVWTIPFLRKEDANSARPDRNLLTTSSDIFCDAGL